MICSRKPRRLEWHKDTTQSYSNQTIVDNGSNFHSSVPNSQTSVELNLVVSSKCILCLVVDSLFYSKVKSRQQKYTIPLFYIIGLLDQWDKNAGIKMGIMPTVKRWVKLFMQIKTNPPTNTLTVLLNMDLLVSGCWIIGRSVVLVNYIYNVRIVGCNHLNNLTKY